MELCILPSRNLGEVCKDLAILLVESNTRTSIIGQRATFWALGERPVYNKVLLASAAALQVSCAISESAASSLAVSDDARNIIYVSADLKYAMAFSAGRVRTGNLAALAPDLLPSYPVREVAAGDGVRCLSIGPPSNSLEFAIKRPIRRGDEYRCLATSFRVTQCFENCRAATIEVRWQRPDDDRNDTLRSYMYVDACRGLVAYSNDRDLSDGIPLQAPLLRGQIGILAEVGQPNCHSF